MKTIDIAMFVRNRYEHLVLCASWLKKSKPADLSFRFIAYDDDSSDPRVLPFLQKTFDEVVKLSRDALAIEPEQRIGYARKCAVQAFLKESKSNYLLLLDSDIIVSRTTIAEAVSDYEALNDWIEVGGATLYALSHISGQIHALGKKFASVTLTGDAHMLFKREHLSQIGNHFSTKPKGFADNQITAIRSYGKSYFTRIDPPYLVQHIGFGEGASLIYKTEKFRPSWTMKPYWTHENNRRILQVENFDVLHYVKCVESVGGVNAPEEYMKTKGIGNERD